MVFYFRRRDETDLRFRRQQISTVRLRWHRARCVSVLIRCRARPELHSWNKTFESMTTCYSVLALLACSVFSHDRVHLFRLHRVLVLHQQIACSVALRSVLPRTA